MGVSKGEYLAGGSVSVCSIGCVFVGKCGSGRHSIDGDGGACGVALCIVCVA